MLRRSLLLTTFLLIGSLAIGRAADQPKPAEKDKPAAKPADTKPAEAKPVEKKPEAKPAEKSAEKPAVKPVEPAKPAEKPAAKPAEKPAEPATPPTKPAEPAKPATPPAKPAEPAKPVAPPAKPAEAAKPAEGQVSFSKEVAPILLKNCAACHGATDFKGDYQVHTFAALMKAGESGDASITPGDISKSYLYELISTTDAGSRMPKDGDPLKPEQIALIKKWIEQGAKYDAADKAALLASIVPKKAHPAPPEAYRVPIAVTALALSPDGKEVAVGGYHEITIWDTAKGELRRRIKNFEERTYSLAYNSDGKLLAAAGGTPGQSGEVTLFDPASGAVVKTLGTMSDVAFGAAFNPKGDKLAACAADRSIRIYDVASGKEERLIEDHADWVMGVAWNQDGTLLASASRDKTSKVFETKTGESQATYPGHGDTVYGVAFSPDGKQVISCGADKRVHVWNPADGKQIGLIGGFTGEVYKALVRGDQIYSASSDKQARQHKVADRALVKAFPGANDYVYAVDFNPTAKLVAAGTFDGEVCLFDAEKGTLTIRFRAAPGYVPPAATAKK
jgi:WD40 repeat protein/mono/diheme cytochrome c family protein